MNEEIAKTIVSKTIKDVNENPYAVKENGCAACHVLFTL